MSAKKKTGRTARTTRKSAPRRAVHPAPSLVLPGEPATRSLPLYRELDEDLLVCLQDPFPTPGTSSLIRNSEVPAGGGQPGDHWRLEATLEMNPPRVFAGWATRGSFTIDLKANALVTEAAGTWGGTVRSSSASSPCRVIVLRTGDKKLRFSLPGGCQQAGEKRLPRPDPERHLNADVAFATRGKEGLAVAATAVVSNLPWARLITGSSADTEGLAFDNKWRRNLDEKDGSTTAQGSFAFAVMSRSAYTALCAANGWPEKIV